MNRKGKLTTKGKHAVILTLTIVACVAAMLFSLLLSVLCDGKHVSSAAHAQNDTHFLYYDKTKKSAKAPLHRNAVPVFDGLSYSLIFILFLVNIVDQSLTVNNFLHERRERLALI